MSRLTTAEADVADVIAFDVLCQSFHILFKKFAAVDAQAAREALEELADDIERMAEHSTVEPFDLSCGKRILAAGYDKARTALHAESAWQ